MSNEAVQFSSGVFDWSNYDQLRPEYPDKLFDMIFAYHAEHASSNGMVVDFGCGPGTIFSHLLSKFDRVVGTDAAQYQLDSAAVKFKDAVGTERLALHAVPAGQKADEDDWVADGEVDMITAAEAIHWFDRDAWFDQAARKLRKGGTLAYWYYTTKPLLYTNLEAEKIWNEMHQICLGPAVALAAKNGGRLAHTMGANQTTIKSFASPPTSLFSQAERHSFELAPSLQDAWIKPAPDEIEAEITAREPTAFTLKLEGSKTFEHLPEGDRAGFLVKADWTSKHLVAYLDSLAVSGFDPNSERLQSLKKQLEAVVGGEDAKLGCAWPMHLVLATKI